MNKRLLKAILLGVARTALAGVSGYLIRTGYISAEHYELLLAGLAGLAATFVWSSAQKAAVNTRLGVAASMRAGASPEDVSAEVKRRKRLNRERGYPLVSVALAVLLCALPPLALTGCGEEGAGRVATGLHATARGIGSGIDTVRAFREAGELSRERALELARLALDVNTLAGEAAQFLVGQDDIDEADRARGYEQLQKLLAAARRLEENGTLHIKNQRAKLIFDLGLVAADSALAAAADELSQALGDGVKVAVSPEVKARLGRALTVIERNDARLKEAIRRLSGDS